MSNIKPMGERVLALPIEHEEKTESGIYLAETNTMVARAKVLRAGTKAYEKHGLKESDVIIYKKGFGIKIDDNILLNVDDILAIVED